MFRRIDQSPALAKFILRLSNTLAKQRGLLTVIGIVLVFVSFIISLVNLSVQNTTLDVIWSVTLHMGIIVALIGLLLVEPLGR